ncbi:MAG: metallophosphoesterase family protein [Phascolarctobacterium sp.]|nr:metallophosphoesterase family protein [Phascolarctobacterium sp.]
MNKKIIFLIISCMALFLAGCGSVQQDTRGSDSSVGVSYVRQLVAKDNGTSRTIMWQSEVRQGYSVEYRLKSIGNNGAEQGVTKKSSGETGAVFTQAATECSFKEAKIDYLQYQVQLKGLQPNSVYEYRIVTEKNKGSWHSLKTNNAKGFTALIFPDSQSSDYSGWQQLARAAQQRHKESELYINMGDLVDNGQDGSQWRAWLGSVEPFSADLAFAPVIGNHEAYSLDWKMTPPKAYTNLFAVPENGLPEYKRQFYSFDYGPVHFTVLDTNFHEAQGWQPRLLADELRWLEQDLAKSKARWKIVLQHRDIFMYGFSKESGRPERATFFLDFSRQLMPLYEKYGVDAVLSAHLHTYRRRMPLRNFAPSEDGITYILTGVAGNVRYPKLWGDFAWDAARAPQPETANYMTLDVSQEKLLFRAFLPDGKQFDEVEIKK